MTSLARSMGWLGIGVGTMELAFPRTLARAMGIRADRQAATTLRLLGLRELATGISVVLRPASPWPLWARVAGDAIDLALLGVAAVKRTSGVKLATAIAAVGGVTALDVLASVKAHRSNAQAKRPVVYSVTINQPPSVVYAFYRDFARLPELMEYLEEVHERDRRRSRWIAKSPAGKKPIAWEVEILEDIPNEVIAWQSVEGSAIQVRGRVTFAKAPGRDATEVRVEMQLGFTGIGASATLAKYFTRPQIESDLRRLKQIMETGEVLSLRDHPRHPEPMFRSSAPR